MWLGLVPIAAFLVAFAVGALVLWYVAKHSRITETQTSSGRGLHLETPIGTLDSRPEKNLDPRLAKLPLYPGAMRLDPNRADTVATLGYGHTAMQEVSTTYWTPDSEESVWHFYRSELPDWPRNLVKHLGKELIHDEPDGVRLIRITREQDRTLIETCIKPPGYPNLLSY